MKITVLTENTCKSGKYNCEHGLSLYIETEKYNILFDMGQTSLFAENAERLGINLDDVHFAVLSHGHYDHGGGLAKFLEINETAPVYVSRHAFGSYFHGEEKYIGLDESLKSNDRLVFTPDTFEVLNGFTLYSCNERQRKYNLGSFGLFECVDGEFKKDSFLHEQYLMIEECGKKVLISGCSHKGILNIAEWFKADAVVGGFHFSGLPVDNVLKGYAELLDRLDTEFYTCHCTGTEQYCFMKQHMRNLSYISVGDTFEI